MTNPTATSQAEALLPEVRHEAALTRRVLERLPDPHFAWQPHPKSMTLTQLASHTADMLAFMAITLQTPEFDLAAPGGDDYQPAPDQAALLARLDRGTQDATQALREMTNAALAETWVLRAGPQVIQQDSRAATVRHLISHLVHHRAQLLVYLRLLDLSVPGIYGPSADEKGE